MRRLACQAQRAIGLISASITTSLSGSALPGICALPAVTANAGEAGWPRNVASEAGTSSRCESGEIRCWKCGQGGLHGHHRGGFFCAECGAIRSVSMAQDLFALLGLGAPRYRLDPRELDLAFRKLQFELHPDRFTGAPERERQLSESASSLVNKAYATLRSPLLRAQYLLRQRGIETDTEGTIEDPELLMEMMEMREEVEAEGDPGRLREMKEQAAKRQGELEESIGRAFDEEDLSHAQALVVRLIYLSRAAEELLQKAPHE